jgi:hypothetical protein
VRNYYDRLSKIVREPKEWENRWKVFPIL